MAEEATLESQIGDLLDQETFPPPEAFVESALVTDESLYEKAAEDYEGFWAEQAESLDWAEKWDQVLDWSDPPNAKWFVGGKLNVAYNCVDRHVEAGNGDRVAFHWRGEEGEELDVTYADLHRDVQKFANALKDRGVGPKDVVGIFLPMIPEVAVAMLACARIGAVHNVVFGGFSAESVKERMEFSEAKALVTVDGARRKGKTAAIKEQVDEVLGELESIETIFVVKRTDNDAPMKEGRDIWYQDALDEADDECEAEPFDSEHPLYILYSSGSTAKPKGILHTTGGYLTGVAWTHKYVFDLKPEEDVYWCSADVGWVTGHSYIVYGPLANGCTSVMYEGAPGLPGQGHLVVAGRPLRRDDLLHGADGDPRVHQVGRRVPGEARPLLAAAARDASASRSTRRPGSGTTRSSAASAARSSTRGGRRRPGHIMITTLPGAQETKPGSAGKPLPGIDALVVNEDDGEDSGTDQGLLTLRKPWPGMLRTLYKDEDRFIETYWDKFGRDIYFVGDAARKDEDGYYWIIGRVDDVINVSGHRLSTAEVEGAIVSHDKVAEAAVIGQQDEDSGQAITAFVTLSGSQEGDDDMVADIREHVAKRIGKLARPKRIIWADDLPKTRSGKIMRRLLRDIAEGKELGDVTTLRDPDVVSQLEGKVKERQADGEE